MDNIFEQIANVERIRVTKRVRFALVAVAIDVMADVGSSEVAKMLASDVLYRSEWFDEKFTIALLVKHPDVDIEAATGVQIKGAVLGIWNAFAENKSA